MARREKGGGDPEYFGADVVGCADGDGGVNGAVGAHAEAGAEVGELDVPGGVEEDVVGLDVAVDVAEGVAGADGEGHLGDVEAGHVLGEAVLELGEEGEEVAADVVVHEEVEVALVLEGVVEVGEPVPVPVHQHRPLLPEARRLRPLQHLPLVQLLHRVHLQHHPHPRSRPHRRHQRHLVGALEADDGDLPEGAPPDHLLHLQVVDAQAQLLCPAHHRTHWNPAIHLPQMSWNESTLFRPSFPFSGVLAYFLLRLLYQLLLVVSFRMA